MTDANASNDKERKTASGRYLTSKIARLPNDTREELNRRLLDNEPAAAILSWLNDLLPVKAILAAQFAGAPITRQNLAAWRRTGYPLWFQQEQFPIRFYRLGQAAGKVASAGRDTIARGSATILSGQLFELIQTTSAEKPSTDDIAKTVTAVKPLLYAEQIATRLQIAHERLRQRDLQLLLQRDKHQRDVVAIGLRLLGDQRAKEIEASDCNNAEKIELLGIHTFGDLWEPRPIPAPQPVAPARDQPAPPPS